MRDRNHNYLFTDIFEPAHEGFVLLCFSVMQKISFKLLIFSLVFLSLLLRPFQLQRTKDILPHFPLLVLLFHFFHLNTLFTIDLIC